MIERHALWLVAILGSCVGYRPAQFIDALPVVDANDEQLVPRPVKRISSEELHTAEAYVLSVARGLEVSRPPLGGDVNSLDEVVRSSWFQPRPETDLLAGYRQDGPPKMPVTLIEDEELPIDATPTMLVQDARGLRYQLVFDLPNVEETRTAAMVIASRLFFALGYHVAETYIIRTFDGLRAAAVRYPAGDDLGPTPMLWTRPDDPNDELPHEERRSLRASRVAGAWLGLDHFPEDMFRDVFIGEAGRGFVRHMLLGFEGGLGTDALEATRDDAFDPHSDDTPGGLLLVTLGMYPKPDRLPPTTTGSRGVGLYPPDVRFEEFTIAPPFPPHQSMRADDAYWLLKRINAVPARTLDRVIDAAKLSEPRSRRYLRNVLQLRRNALSEQIFALVTPVDVVKVAAAPNGAARIQLLDQETRALEKRERQRYRVNITDLDGKPLASSRNIVSRGARFSVSLESRLFVDREVVVVRIFKLSGDAVRAESVDLHIRRDERGVRLLGVEH